MEELDRELRLAQDACQRLKSQVFVAHFVLLIKFLKVFLFMFFV